MSKKQNGSDVAAASGGASDEPNEVKLCCDCNNMVGRIKSFGPVYECRSAKSKSLVTGDSPTSCVEMRGTLCGMAAALFEPKVVKPK